MASGFRTRRKPYRGPNYQVRRWVLLALLVLMAIVALAYGADYLFPGPIPESR